jgi:phosphoribosyl 1,2-cyclic phosphodiesterase
MAGRSGNESGVAVNGRSGRAGAAGGGLTVTLWGTRGSVPAPGPDTVRYGGNTACVAVDPGDGTLVVLDAGTGIRRLGAASAPAPSRVDLLLTHLHMDHIQGLGFFGLLRVPDVEAHIWGPASATHSLRERLARYLSPPLFPVRVRDLPRLQLHEVPCGEFAIGRLRVSAAYVCHPNPTVGYRLAAPEGTVAYLPDHEPALGLRGAFHSGAWTSGYALAVGADLLIHDAQYTDAEYAERAGWGHSSIRQAFAFAALAEVQQLVPFHHDPSHSDGELDDLLGAAVDELQPRFRVAAGAEGETFHLG